MEKLRWRLTITKCIIYGQEDGIGIISTSIGSGLEWFATKWLNILHPEVLRKVLRAPLLPGRTIMEPKRKGGGVVARVSS